MTGARRLPWGRFLLVGALVALDLWSKAAVFGWLEGGADGMVPDRHGHLRYPLAGDWLALMLSRNTGAAWGILQSYTGLLVAGRVAAVAVIGWLLAKSARPWLTGALVLVLSGALGNLYDNLLLEPEPGTRFGAVRDFIDVYFTGWDYHFPTFNAADSCITCGAVILLLSGFFGAEEEASDAGEGSGEQGARSPAA